MNFDTEAYQAREIDIFLNIMNIDSHLHVLHWKSGLSSLLSVQNFLLLALHLQGITS